MKKDIYLMIKTELEKQSCKTTHFTRQFLKDFIKAQKTIEENIKNNVDDSYISKGYIKLFHSYDNIYTSKFYNLNSSVYCVFLEVWNRLVNVKGACV